MSRRLLGLIAALFDQYMHFIPIAAALAIDGLEPENSFPGMSEPWTLKKKNFFGTRAIEIAERSPEFTEQVQHLLWCCCDGTMLLPTQP
jgi:hypothetical protein